MQGPDNLESKRQRRIGIDYALRFFIEEGLVKEDETFPDKAARYVKNRTELKQKRAYKRGAKDCAIALIDAFIKGEFTTNKKEDGTYEVECHLDNFKWERQVHKWSKETDEETVEIEKHELTLKELGFE